MRKLIAAILIFGLGSLVSAGVAQAADVTLKLGLASSGHHPFNLAAYHYRDLVAKMSKGAIKIQIYPDRQLGDDKELTQAVRFGTVDMTINSGWPNLDHAIYALQLPFLIDSYTNEAKILTTPEAAALSASLSKKGVKVLAYVEGGERHFMTKNRQIKTLADMKGLKTRVAPVRLYLDIFKALGTNPTPMAYGEVYTALQTGTIDAVETNISSIANEKYYEVAHRVVLTGHYFWPGELVVNAKRFASLKPAYQKILQKAASESVVPQVDSLNAYDKKEMAFLKTKGVIFTQASPALLAEMRKAVRPIYTKYMKMDPAIEPFVKAAEKITGIPVTN